MRDLTRTFLVACLLVPFALALSDQTTLFYKQLGVLRDKLEKNRKAIDQYNGGILATGPLGTSGYELWSAFRIGNVRLREATANATICPQEERADVMDAVYKFGFDGVQTMKVYQKKASPPRQQAYRENFISSNIGI